MDEVDTLVIGGGIADLPASMESAVRPAWLARRRRVGFTPPRIRTKS